MFIKSQGETMETSLEVNTNYVILCLCFKIKKNLKLWRSQLMRSRLHKITKCFLESRNKNFVIKRQVIGPYISFFLLFFLKMALSWRPNRPSHKFEYIFTKRFHQIRDLHKMKLKCM